MIVPIAERATVASVLDKLTANVSFPSELLSPYMGTEIFLAIGVKPVVRDGTNLRRPDSTLKSMLAAAVAPPVALTPVTVYATDTVADAASDNDTVNATDLVPIDPSTTETSATETRGRADPDIDLAGAITNAPAMIPAANN
jgi:hypothetical protein